MCVANLGRSSSSTIVVSSSWELDKLSMAHANDFKVNEKKIKLYLIKSNERCVISELH